MARLNGAKEIPGLGGRLFALLRGRRGSDGGRLTQTDLAEITKISRPTIGAAFNDDLASERTVAALAKALGVTVAALTDDAELTPTTTVRESSDVRYAANELEEFLSNFDRVVLTLRNFPGGALGVKLKIEFLNAVEDIARETGNKLPLEYYSLRKRVADGEL